MKNPYRTTLKTGEAGRVSESRLAKTLGARLTPASGALVGAKGDMKLPDYLIEAKSTSTNTMSLQLAWAVKISEEALATAKTPAITISFTNDQGKSNRFGDWVLIPLHHYKELTSK